MKIRWRQLPICTMYKFAVHHRAHQDAQSALWHDALAASWHLRLGHVAQVTVYSPSYCTVSIRESRLLFTCYEVVVKRNSTNVQFRVFRSLLAYVKQLRISMLCDHQRDDMIRQDSARYPVSVARTLSEDIQLSGSL